MPDVLLCLLPLGDEVPLLGHVVALPVAFLVLSTDFCEGWIVVNARLMVIAGKDISAQGISLRFTLA